MKLLGAICIVLGCILISLVLFYLLNGNQEPLSPIPESNGVKVIFISPTK